MKLALFSNKFGRMVRDNKATTLALVIMFGLIFSALFLGNGSVQAQKGEDAKGGSGVIGDEEGGGGGGGNLLLTGPADVCGFAWGATSEDSSPKSGLGWISFNSKDCDTDGNGTISSGEASAFPGCSTGVTGAYKVSVDNDRNLVGYAWSSNLGWLKFGDLTDFPTGSGTSQANARVDSNNNSDNNVSGWARFCAGTANASGDGDCTSMNSRTDGWDGWLSLRGTSNPYGVVFNGQSNRFSGYSWGGPTVGWVKWDQADGSGVRLCDAAALTASLSANPSVGTPAQLSSVTLTANTNFSSGASYRFACTAADSLSTAQSSNTFNCSNKYTNENTSYVARVEVTSNGQTVTAQASIETNDGNNPTDSDPQLSIECRVPAGQPFVSDQGNVPINRTVYLQAVVTVIGDPTAVIPPFSYEFMFDDNNNEEFGTVGDVENVVIPPVANNFSESTSRVYRQLGQKTFKARVGVLDSQSNMIYAECQPQTINVVVDPTIIEI